MAQSLDEARRHANDTRYLPGQRAGHYESFFVRANHPVDPQAFWIRYTIFAPDGRPEEARGELWAVFFDGTTGAHTAVKRELPIAECEFRRDGLGARVGESRLEPGRLAGEATTGTRRLAWELAFAGDSPPLFALPISMYEASLPRAKTLVPLPLARFRGSLEVDGRAIAVHDWVGSQNHNWGSRHTDLYAWGQVAGFDEAPESFLEVATARLRIGPLWTPHMTVLVLRHAGEEIALNSLGQSLRAHGRFSYFDWTFRSAGATHAVEGRITAPRTAFVGLRYANPPGGVKSCLNSKLAHCELHVTDRRAGGATATRVLTTRHRAAFEILTDDPAHGVELVV